MLVREALIRRIHTMENPIAIRFQLIHNNNSNNHKLEINMQTLITDYTQTNKHTNEFVIRKLVCNHLFSRKWESRYEKNKITSTPTLPIASIIKVISCVSFAHTQQLSKSSNPFNIKPCCRKTTLSAEHSAMSQRFTCAHTISLGKEITILHSLHGTQRPR